MDLKLEIDFLRQFDVIHASPPCQAYTDYGARDPSKYPDLIAPLREMLIQAGRPYIIENVDRAPLKGNVTLLCGTQFPEFGIRVIRHRKFETSFYVPQPAHLKKVDHPLIATTDKRQPHYGKLDQNQSFVTVTGGGNCSLENALDAMGIPFHMSKRQVNQAIPPAYTQYIGKYIQ